MLWAFGSHTLFYIEKVAMLVCDQWIAHWCDLDSSAPAERSLLTLSQSARAAGQNPIDWGRGSYPKHLFSQSSGGWTSEIRVPTWLGADEASLSGFQIADILLLTVSSHGEQRGKEGEREGD